MALVIKDLAQACCHPQTAGSSCPDQPCMVSNGDWVGCLQRLVLQMCSHIKHFPSRKACQAQPARSSALGLESWPYWACCSPHHPVHHTA